MQAHRLRTKCHELPFVIRESVVGLLEINEISYEDRLKTVIFADPVLLQGDKFSQSVGSVDCSLCFVPQAVAINLTVINANFQHQFNPASHLRIQKYFGNILEFLNTDANNPRLRSMLWDVEALLFLQPLMTVSVFKKLCEELRQGFISKESSLHLESICLQVLSEPSSSVS